MLFLILFYFFSGWNNRSSFLKETSLFILINISIKCKLIIDKETTSANIFEGESVEEKDKLGNSKESELFFFFLNHKKFT